jgi:hypothetical protein
MLMGDVDVEIVVAGNLEEDDVAVVHERTARCKLSDRGFQRRDLRRPRAGEQFAVGRDDASAVRTDVVKRLARRHIRAPFNPRLSSHSIAPGAVAVRRAHTSVFLALEDGEDVVLAHDEMLLAIDLDLPGLVCRRDQIARFDIESTRLPAAFTFAEAGVNDLALLRLLFGGVRNDDAADCLFAFFKTPNQTDRAVA